MKCCRFFFLFFIVTESLGQKPIIRDRPIIGTLQQLEGPKIVLYENSNFSGRSKELGIGSYRLDDFNDIASSIKIPAGLAVFMYEHFDDDGGYGMYADWVADLSDLNQVSLNDKMSFITVFSAEREGLVWMPSGMQNGQVVPGHWERKRVNPAPLGNPIAGQSNNRGHSQPHSEDADVGYGPLWIDLGEYTPWYWPDFTVDFDANDIKVNNAQADINLVCPQHRSVGETEARSLPKKTYVSLEGIVKTSGLAYADFPTSHYTHDFNFTVTPDPAYHFVFGDHITGPGPNGVGWTRADSQDEIEVEWESGLGQDNVLDGVANPATASNRYGNSFGFFSAGHKSKDLLWNWPSDGDRVHVEGLWIWERAHQPVHTEIHPAHFVAVQRKNPVSFILDGAGIPLIRNQADDKYIGTRVDVFASADGNPMFNTKGLNPGFNQVQDMNRKDFSFKVKTPFSRVVPTTTATHNSILRCKFIKQKGDSFPGDPIIDIVGEGEVRITVPWMSRNVANTAVFARSFVIYWEDQAIAINTATTKVLEAEKPKLYQIDIVRIDFKRKQDGDDGYGDFRIYGNVGSNWVFLNEFGDQTDGVNILSTGMGHATSTSGFQILKSFNIYVPATASRLNNNIIYDNVQIKTCGWEADAVDIFMGHLINEYSRDGGVFNKFWGGHLKYLDDHGRADEPVGNINKLFNPLVIDQENNTGLQTLSSNYSEKSDGTWVTRNVFDLTYRIRQIPFSATSGGNRPGVLMDR